MTDPVLLESSAGVATVLLARPELSNSLTREVATALVATLRDLKDDREVRAVVLTGMGAFSIGLDVAEDDPAAAADVDEALRLLTTLPVPVVAAVAGTAAGAGLGLACACDLRVGVAGGRFTTAYAGVGLPAGGGLSWTLPRLVGAGRAAGLLLLAEPFTAEQALDMGLLTAVVPQEQVLATAQEVARRLASGPTASYAQTRALLAAPSPTLAAALDAEARARETARTSADHPAARQAFLDGVAPTFEGR